MIKLEQKARLMIARRSDSELITDWIVLDEATKDDISISQAEVRGWLMDEIQKRFPQEFDNWIKNCAENDNIEDYIKI